jgi:hypothetical protein
MDKAVRAKAIAEWVVSHMAHHHVPLMLDAIERLLFGLALTPYQAAVWSVINPVPATNPRRRSRHRPKTTADYNDYLARQSERDAKTKSELKRQDQRRRIQEAWERAAKVAKSASEI